MSRKNKYLKAFLHQNESPTIEQAWNCAWKHAQKTFHSRSMQDMEGKVKKLTEALQDCRDVMEAFNRAPGATRDEWEFECEVVEVDILLSEMESEK